MSGGGNFLPTCWLCRRTPLDFGAEAPRFARCPQMDDRGKVLLLSPPAYECADCKASVESTDPRRLTKEARAFVQRLAVRAKAGAA